VRVSTAIVIGNALVVVIALCIIVVGPGDAWDLVSHGFNYSHECTPSQPYGVAGGQDYPPPFVIGDLTGELIYNAWPYADSDLAIDNMDTTYGWFVVGDRGGHEVFAVTDVDWGSGDLMTMTYRVDHEHLVMVEQHEPTESIGVSE